MRGACPVPVAKYERVVLGHGSGGRLSHELFKQVFLPCFPGLAAHALEDQASLRMPHGGRLAFTTDAFVVQPLFFPGGDIGSLSVYGTVNDLAMGGARPMYLAASFVLEEGFEIERLERIVLSLSEACKRSQVELVTGDTKVVERGKGDGLFITTTGIGLVPHELELSATQARVGDRVIISGHLGDHGIAVLAAREGIELETALLSDSAPLHELVGQMLTASRDIRCMRDPTRGGLSSALNEIAIASKVGIEVRESFVPVRAEVRAVCELLGLDPFYVANEGKLVAIVAPDSTDTVLAAMRRHPLGEHAVVIGEVVADHPRLVTVRSLVGGERTMPMLAGEQLPRIC